ncbi:MAG: ArsR family transcriptional regulator [Candidatus Thermoplasmatota archaeon]|nr:ArsR family transcriptional regulator [Candidatus Thermoplasmatota archaeon]
MRERDDADHLTRDRLIERIRDRPGLSFSDLMRAMNLNEGTLRYHLNYLEKRKIIRSRKEGVRRLYFATILSPTLYVQNTDLSREDKRVLTLIRHHPGIKPSDILSMFGLTHNDLNRIVHKLKRERFIWEVENGNGIGLEVITRKRLIEEIMLDIIERFLKGDIDQNTFMRLKSWIEEEEQNN